MNWRGALRLMIAALLLGPILIWPLIIGWPTWPPDHEWPRALFTSMLQAGLSAWGSVVVGVIGALGFLAVGQGRRRRALEILCLLPGALPPVVVVLSLLLAWPSQWSFPFGLTGVVVAHMAMNVGWLAVALARIIETHLGTQIELAWTEGATRGRVARQVVWPQLRQNLFHLGLTVLALSLTSFAIPLVLGGVGATSLEMLIYQRAILLDLPHEAFFLALLQLFSLMLLALGLRSSGVSLRSIRRNSESSAALKWLGFWPGLAAPMLCSFWALFAPLGDMNFGFAELRGLPEVMSRISSGLAATVIVSSLVGFGVFVFLALLSGLLPHPPFRKFLLGYFAPSSVIVAIAILPLGPQLGSGALIKLGLALVLIFAPLLYRMGLDEALTAMAPQVQVARTLGASWPLIWRRILLPQLAPLWGWCAGLAALWAAGDFAVSGILLHQETTLAQTLAHLLGSYRLEAASAVLILVLIVGAAHFAAFWSLGHVVGRTARS